MKIFVSGSISIKKLPQIAVEKLNSIIAHNFTVLAGDANGVDCLIQEYLKENLTQMCKFATQVAELETISITGRW